MPHYLFDITDAGRSSEDEVGVELADDREARDEAIGLLSNIIRDVFPDGDQHEINVKARNRAGEVVYEATWSLDGKWWPGRR